QYHELYLLCYLQAEDGIRARNVTGVQTCALPISLPSERVTRVLDQIIEWRGKPACLRCDNGPEYISKILLEWAAKRHITLIHTQPGIHHKTRMSTVIIGQYVMHG